MTAPNDETTLRRYDLLVVWGRAIAHAVGYNGDQARALGVAWAARRVDARGRQPRSGLRFAGHVFERFEALGQVGYTAHGRVHWPAEYDETKARIGRQHDELLAVFGDVLATQPIVKLDETLAGAELLTRRLLAAGVSTGYHRIGIARVLAAIAA